MANFNSDNVVAGAITDLYDPSHKTLGAVSHARMRKKSMRLQTGATTSSSDTMVLGFFKSADRIYDIRISSNSATATTGAIDLGLYKAALDHLPVAANIIDVDLFASALATTTVMARVDALVEAATILDFSRGLTLWEMADLGAATHTVDPMEDWDLVATFTTALDAAQGYLVEVDYVSFG